MCVVVLVVALMFDVDVEVEETLLRATSYKNNMGDGNGLNLLASWEGACGFWSCFLDSWLVDRGPSSCLVLSCLLGGGWFMFNVHMRAR